MYVSLEPSLHRCRSAPVAAALGDNTRRWKQRINKFSQISLIKNENNLLKFIKSNFNNLIFKNQKAL